jgi:RNA polymerase sigma-70 factor, ECF subfamily
MMALAMSGAAFPQVRSGAIAPFDPALVERCRAQDPMAFRAFVVRHEQMVFALLSRMLGRGPEVEDLAQETFVRAFRAFPRFDPDGPAKLSTWLLTIATRVALDSRKRRRLEVQKIEEGNERPRQDALEYPRSRALALEHECSMGATPESSLERQELGRAISEAAAKLPDDQRAALVLAEIHGLSIAEIAEALDVPESTAKTRLFRAREKMRAALTAEWRTK